MKFCEECGAQLENDAAFCEECGASVEVTEDAVLETNVIAENSKENELSKKKDGKGKIVGGILGGIIAIVGVAAGLYFLGVIPSFGNSGTKTVKSGNDEVVTGEAVAVNGQAETTATAKPTVTPTVEPTVIPTVEPTATPKPKDNTYIFKNSRRDYLTVADVIDLSKKKLRLARNEIFARRGYIFEDKELKEYFEGKSWYKPKIKSSEFSESMLNDYERSNLDLIKQAESGELLKDYELWNGCYIANYEFGTYELNIYDTDETGFFFDYISDDGTELYELHAEFYRDNTSVGTYHWYDEYADEYKTIDIIRDPDDKTCLEMSVAGGDPIYFYKE